VVKGGEIGGVCLRRASTAVTTPEAVWGGCDILSDARVKLIAAPFDGEGLCVDQSVGDFFVG